MCEVSSSSSLSRDGTMDQCLGGHQGCLEYIAGLCGVNRRYYTTGFYSQVSHCFVQCFLFFPLGLQNLNLTWVSCGIFIVRFNVERLLPEQLLQHGEFHPKGSSVFGLES